MNRPMTPKAMRPPMTPAKISSNGKSAPLLMRNGRMKLSTVPTKIVQTIITVPQRFWSFQKSHTTTGMSTSPGPTWATQRTNMTADRSAGAGTPATTRPMPPRIDWTRAVTTTPSATPRTALPARMTAFSPCSPPSRRANRRTPTAAVSPVAYRTALMITVSRN